MRAAYPRSSKLLTPDLDRSVGIGGKLYFQRTFKKIEGYMVSHNASSTQVFPLYGGSFSSSARRLNPQGSIVVLHARKGVQMKHPAGTVLCRRAVRGRKHPVWIPYREGLYSALLAEMHVSGNIASPVGELAEVDAAVLALPEYAKMIFAPAMVGVKEAKEMEALLSYLTRNFGQRWNEQRIVATLSLIRSGQVRDSLGRQNPGARAMAVGNAIGELIKRRKSISRILIATNARELSLHKEIQRIMCIYSRLLIALRGIDKSSGTAGILALAFRAKAHEGRVVRKAIKEIESLIRSFGSAIVQPFKKNVLMMIKDLCEAKRQLLGWLQCDVTPDMRKEFRNICARLRAGATWARALHYMQEEVNIPLSIILHELEGEHASRRKIVGGGPVSICGDLGDSGRSRFAAILSKMEGVRAKMHRISDAHLEHPVRDDVLRWIEEAISFAVKSDWIEAQVSFRKALSFL